ncbi:MAG: polynucleotide adenylyltransferase PcnB [Verrucomicrobia bacterium]|nr:polynucleotide adenylyltransferase PcnB [Verrucomicrobiota bacterium]
MSTPHKPKIYTAEEHPIRDDLVDDDALYVLRSLHQAGYTAYLVGGGVRDLLMNHQPKDFDISTSAQPEDIKKVFGRRCLLIGRRFRLAHVRFGKKVIEVSTFRAGESGQEELILRDNIWGSEEEDVLRRDFTVNGLFYDPLDHRIIDYVGGVKDLEQKLLRCIGKPEVRFKQDPVRMIRALKFQARFAFQVDPPILQGIETCRDEILKCAPARLLEELLRMLESGASVPFITLMKQHQLLDLLLPTAAELLTSPLASQIYALLGASDEWLAAKPPIPPDRAVLATSLVWPLFEHAIKTTFTDKERTPNLGQVHALSYDLVQDTFVEIIPRFTKRLCQGIAFILESQYRMTPLTHRKTAPKKLTEQSDYQLALQFLRLRSLVDPSLRPVYEKWKELKAVRRVEYRSERPQQRKRRRR